MAAANDDARRPPAGDEPSGEPRPSPWRAVAAGLTVVYVVWYVIDLIVLNVDAGAFNAVHRQADGFVPRLVFAVLALGIVSHALDGLRRTLCDLVPSLQARDPALRLAVRFLTPAVWIPAGIAVVWPAVRAWWLS